ncbi:acyl-CoA dehydrogenase family protein [Sphingorhabdus sp.]|uniref:acyl-CoA dehydrogenase family protein n=1 Tax=Sphingorhabdus sp. TaxID=1902408 RepID=UPI004053D567
MPRAIEDAEARGENDMQMAGLGYSEEQIELLDVATSFCRDKSPIARVRKLMDSDLGYDADVWAEMAALGWTAIAIPEAHGGVGLSLAEVVPVVEQMGRHLMASPLVSSTLAAQALIIGGSEQQTAHWLPKLAEGAIGTLALSEAHGDWDLENITATATVEGDAVHLSGEKLFVAWAQTADIVIASVMLDGRPALVLLTAADVAGRLRREAIIDETRRSFALSLNGLVVSRAALLEIARTSSTLSHIEQAANLLQSAEMCGGSQSVIDYTVSYLQTRKQFGKTIGEYQALKHPTVDAYVEYEKARSHLYSAANSFSDQGVGEIAVRMAKAAADATYSFAADRAIQFHGGFGFTHDCDAGLHRRAAIFQASQFGDAAWQRFKLAPLLLG